MVRKGVGLVPLWTFDIPYAWAMRIISSGCRRIISFRVLAEHLSDIDITGHDAWSATFVSDEGDDFIVSSKKVKEIALDGRKVCCRRAMGVKNSRSLTSLVWKLRMIHSRREEPREMVLSRSDFLGRGS